MPEWRQMSEAPKNGTEIRLRLDLSLPGYWDSELSAFVLSRPLVMESIVCADGWLPLTRRPDIHGEPHRNTGWKP